MGPFDGIQEASDEAERRYRRFFEGAVEGMWLTSPEGTCLAANPAVARILGYPSAEEFVTTISDTSRVWFDPNAHLELVKKLEEHGFVQRYECRHKRKDGSILWVSLSGKRVCAPDGRTLLYEWFMEDITERKRAEIALLDSEEKFATVFRFVPAGISVADIESGFRFLDINENFAEMVGYKRADILGRNGPELGLWANPEEFREAVKRLRENGRVRNFEFHFRRKDGQVRTGLLSSEPVKLGDRACLASSTLDITELRHVERALRKHTQQFLTIEKCLPDVLWMIDLSGRLTYASPRLERTYGWTVQEAPELTFRDLAPPLEAMKNEQLLREELARTSLPDYDRNSVITFESEQLRKDGTTFWAELRAVLLWSDTSPVGVIGITRDITERKRQETERENLQRQLAHAQKLELVGRLAGGIAHDFNNLMSVILMYADSALDELRCGESAAGSVTAIRDAADRAVAISRQLLAFSNKQIPRTEVLNLNAVISDSKKMLQRLIGEDVNVQFKPGPGLGLVRADRGQLAQVLTNLAVNSRDAMPEGGAFTIETADVELDQSDIQAYPELSPGLYKMLAVRDTGTGMNEDTIAHIFEPFYTTKAVGKGTGLGLSVVYGIIRQSGGFIRVASEPGHGTEFRIYLPVVPEMSRPGLETEEGPMRGGSETVLLVEDEPTLRDEIQRVLEKGGYHVLPAADGYAALRLAMSDTQPIHLLLTDVVMPELSGIRLAERLQAFRQHMKVLYMSGYPDAGTAALSESNFILKPFTKAKLLRRMRDVLDSLGIDS
jgi:two-component system cell cycle sensor histidine kinase/response regulator CckA